MFIKKLRSQNSRLPKFFFCLLMIVSTKTVSVNAVTLNIQKNKYNIRLVTSSLLACLVFLHLPVICHGVPHSRERLRDQVQDVPGQEDTFSSSPPPDLSPKLQKGTWSSCTMLNLSWPLNIVLPCTVQCTVHSTGFHIKFLI